MMQAVEHPDLELLLGPYLRSNLTQWSPKVDRRFPDKTWVPGFAIVIRDDSGPDTSIVTATRSVGLTCIGPQTEYSETRQLAERVASLLRALPDSLSLPVADSTVRGPYSLDAADRVEFYLTAELITVGHTVTI